MKYFYDAEEITARRAAFRCLLCRKELGNRRGFARLLGDGQGYRDRGFLCDEHWLMWQKQPPGSGSDWLFLKKRHEEWVNQTFGVAKQVHESQSNHRLNHIPLWPEINSGKHLAALLPNLHSINYHGLATESDWMSTATVEFKRYLNGISELWPSLAETDRANTISHLDTFIARLTSKRVLIFAERQKKRQLFAGQTAFWRTLEVALIGETDPFSE